MSGMGSGEMSKRAHWVVRLVALAVIAAAATLPRTTGVTGRGAVAGGVLPSGEVQVIHASVAGR
jgi:hypothetical protein